jgi:hypothetical protein
VQRTDDRRRSLDATLVAKAARRSIRSLGAPDLTTSTKPKRLTELDKTVLAIWRALDGIRFHVDRQADPDHGQEWVRNYFEQQRAEVENQRKAFDAVRKRFVAAAYSAAGAKLPRPRPANWGRQPRKS